MVLWVYIRKINFCFKVYDEVSNRKNYLLKLINVLVMKLEKKLNRNWCCVYKYLNNLF